MASKKIKIKKTFNEPFCSFPNSSNDLNLKKIQNKKNYYDEMAG